MQSRRVIFRSRGDVPKRANRDAPFQEAPPTLAARTYRLFNPYERTPPSRRAIGMVLAIAINLLVLLTLLGISGITPVKIKDEGGTLVFDIAREDQAASSQPETQRQRPKQQQRDRPVVPPPEIVLPVPPTITPPETNLDLVELTREEQATTDKAMAESSKAVATAGSGVGGDSAVVGKGPRGEDLYAAEWVREPTKQEINHYLPANAQPGYGVIACKTYPRFRVDDCYRMGSVPASSQLDKVLINAAWQFKIRPPRKNGQLMVGEWVRIRFDLLPAGAD
jgi:protein TonB